MPQKNSSSEPVRPSLFNLIPDDFAATTKKRMDEFAAAQAELFDQYRDASRHWLDRIQVEANMASEFATKLGAARSIPEAMTACQGWTGRRFEMMAEDTQRLLGDTQKIMQAGARLIVDGWQSKNSGVST